MEARLRQALARAEEVARELADPETARNPAKLKQLGREHARLESIRQTSARLERLTDELAQARGMLHDADAELAQLARADVDRLRPEIERLEAELAERLAPSDPLEDRDAIVEIRAGTGGDEAALFAADLFRMYTRFCERRGWQAEVLALSEGNLGGLKEAIFGVRGPKAYGTLRYESGVHRVQRVPRTEQQGRIHTSAATVAVLPEAEDIDVKIEDKDLRIDVFRSGGPGGQSVNTTDSAVRVTHVPTGIEVKCQDQKSQLQNKIKALEILRSRLLDRMIAEQEAARARERRAQVGTGDRSAKIRTYNFPQNRVTDHRIHYSSHDLADVLDGRLEGLVAALNGRANRNGSVPDAGGRTTAARTLDDAVALLERAGIEQARREAVALWAAVEGVTTGTVWLRRDRTPPDAMAARFWEAVERRASGIPFAYAVGRVSFRHLDLTLDPRALIPRPETEGLVDLVLSAVRATGGVAADVGTGCGCVALALATEGHFERVVAVERSADAARLARENVALVAPAVPVDVREGDLLAPLAGEQCRVLVANPPYLTEDEYAGLDRAVRDFEPREALVSGTSGLDATRRILAGAHAVLAAEGILALEIDERRADAVSTLAREYGWSAVIHQDVFGRDRYLLAALTEAS